MIRRHSSTALDITDSSADTTAAIELAGKLLKRARELQTSAERRQQSELDRLIGHDADKATLVEMTDQAFRTHTSARVADQLTHLLDVQGIPQFFNPVERAMLRGFQAFGSVLPGVAVPLVKEKMRHETANVILPAEQRWLKKHLRDRQAQGVVMNVNLIGEAMLGDDETRHRTESYRDMLSMPEVRCLSVKLTTIYSQVSALALDHTIAEVANRLESLYRHADSHFDSDGQPKFLYLDMEEYRDLYLTAAVLKTTLERDGLEQTRAGVALQAYVPDSRRVMRDLIAWSAARVARGGRPLTIRLVKGANMEMERVESSVAGWPLAPYDRKIDTDANFKAMLRDLIVAAADGTVRVGVASHNLFDVSLAIVWAKRAGCSIAGEDSDVESAIQFEMLEGMANHQRRAITEAGQPMLLYAPACHQTDFLHAIGYLIRRLDENTGVENFLRYSHRLRIDAPEFKLLADGFEKSLAAIDTVSDAPRRSQDRRSAPVQPVVFDHWNRFVNEPDTDWSLPHNARWIAGVLDDWKQRDCFIPPPLMDAAAVDHAVGVAAASDWPKTTIQHRHVLLRHVAQKLRERRGDLIAGMVANACKAVAQGDPEVSEAIDFCEFYPLTMRHWIKQSSLSIQPRGVVAVITPWNFPLAIAVGGIAAALSAGNPVILKPSSETLLPAVQLCGAFWDAGVPRDALQMVICKDEVAETLVTDSRVDTVVLTGGTATARRMLSVRPDLHLLAETGGKNATIVTAMSDRDLAIKHVLHSAFGHSGQKCSATSLLLLQAEVFDDREFAETLADAVRSLPVGLPWELQNVITPLVTPPGDELVRGLTTLEPGESWLVQPSRVEGHEHLFRPGVKWNVQRGSFTHVTELFGPVLGVMRFGRLEEAIEIVRSTGYGLTSGLETLDDREIKLWRESIPAGNLYINRPTTGAIVLRQPFGGVGLSAYGPGVKAGGPHYVLALSRVTDGPVDVDRSVDVDQDNRFAPLQRSEQWLNEQITNGCLQPSLSERLLNALASQKQAVASELGGEHDTFKLIGQDNLRRYRPVHAMEARVSATDVIDDVLVSLLAAIAVQTPLSVSVDPASDRNLRELLESLADAVPSLIAPVTQDASTWTARLQESPLSRLRCFSEISEQAAKICGQNFTTIVREPVVTDGRIECLRYVNEQSISYDYHRYGNLGRRAIPATT